MEIEALRHICDMTVRLTELRQAECKHLCIENYAPEIFHRLLSCYVLAKTGTLAPIYHLPSPCDAMSANTP
jgi:hypothetical protein